MGDRREMEGANEWHPGSFYFLHFVTLDPTDGFHEVAPSRQRL
jgi:hypothetical protein